MKSVCLWSLVLLFALTGCGQSAPPVDEELTKRWGPDIMPDPDTEPLQFLYWRVDQLYDTKDANADGRLDLEEFGGLAHNFERIDVDGDGFVTKQEIIDDQVQTMREEGKIP